MTCATCAPVFCASNSDASCRSCGEPSPMRILINSCASSCCSACRTTASLTPSWPTWTTGSRWWPSARRWRRCLPLSSSANAGLGRELAVRRDGRRSRNQRVEQPEEEEHVRDSAHAPAAEGEELASLPDAQEARLHRDLLDVRQGAGLVAAEQLADRDLLPVEDQGLSESYFFAAIDRRARLREVRGRLLIRDAFGEHVHAFHVARQAPLLALRVGEGHVDVRARRDHVVDAHLHRAIAQLDHLRPAQRPDLPAQSPAFAAVGPDHPPAAVLLPDREDSQRE